jgi:hypothetical protein
MGADFSRVRFNPLLDYAGVELQQGRVLLDADANELVGIVDRRLRALASDVLGRATVSSTTPDAFKISVAGGTLQIARGRLYVDGLLAENHGATSDDPAKRQFDDLLAESRFADPIPYAAQPYLPNPPALPAAGRHLVYLDVWDREVTHLERPDLVESAVGVDATSRVQTVWQVRVLDEDAGAGTSCASPDADVPGWSARIAPSTGVLTTGTFDIAATDDPCELPPTGGYRGLENQLYRIEIHNPGQAGAGATFKWSRENASVGSRVASIVSGTELELQTLGRDDVLRFNSDDWVEITDDNHEYAQLPGEMRRITVVEASRRIQFTPALPAAMLPAAFPDSTLPAARNLRVRRWDQKGRVFRTNPGGNPVQVKDLDAPNSTGLIDVPGPGTTLLLENGVTVRFASAGAPGFRRGDYWVFAARTSDASVEVLDRAPPRGIHHHFARLGILDVGAGTVTDCRNPWPPEVEGHDCSCTACVTAQSHASGQFTIQDAVNQVRETGGTICLGPGQYAVAEPVRMVGARSVRIHGRGPATILVGAGGIFALQDCLAVAIENLAIVSLGRETAVSVHTAVGLSLRQLAIVVIGTDAKGSAIALQGVLAGANISENAISARIGIIANDPAAVPPTGENQGEPFLLASALRIEDNVLFCTRQAVALNGTVLHVMSTHIARNEVFGCVEVAISTLGLGAPASAMVVSANTLVVPGNGIRCGLGGAWIEGNKINHATDGRGDANDATIGIAITGGFDKNGVDQCQILSNQVSGFGSAGIEIAVPVRELIVKLNIIESCGNGIVAMAGSNTGSVSIENNLLRNIGPRQDSDTMVIGIGVARADGAAVAGNTIRGVGVQAQKPSLRAAIVTLAVLRPRVNGNDVSDVAPPGEFIGMSAGIMLRAPYTQFEVSQNHVRRDTSPEPRDPVGRWFALVAADFDRNSPISRLGKLATVRVTNDQVLVLNEARASIWAPAGGAPPARGSVLGNALTARGSEPAVDISAGDDCLFNDNRVESLFNRGSTAVRLETTFAIVHANRVRGGETSIDLTRTKVAAVLGNITTGVIAGFAPPPPTAGQPTATWDHLNLRA